MRLAYATYGLQTGRTLENYEGILDTDPPPRAADKSLTAAPLDVIDQPAVDLERACELFPTLNVTLAPLLSLRGFIRLLGRHQSRSPSRTALFPRDGRPQKRPRCVCVCGVTSQTG